MLLNKIAANPVDFVVGLSLGAALILSIFHGSQELSVNIASGMIGYMSKVTITHKGEEKQ